jgi:hypothetical protein
MVKTRLICGVKKYSLHNRAVLKTPHVLIRNDTPNKGRIKVIRIINKVATLIRISIAPS